MAPGDGFDAELLQRPLAQKIIRALSDLESSLIYAKSYCPVEQAKQHEARETLRHLRETCPTVYRAVMRRLGKS
jgi:hypothetical protein